MNARHEGAHSPIYGALLLRTPYRVLAAKVIVRITTPYCINVCFLLVLGVKYVRAVSQILETLASLRSRLLLLRQEPRWADFGVQWPSAFTADVDRRRRSIRRFCCYCWLGQEHNCSLCCSSYFLACSKHILGVACQEGSVTRGGTNKSIRAIAPWVFCRSIELG